MLKAISFSQKQEEPIGKVFKNLFLDCGEQVAEEQLPELVKKISNFFSNHKEIFKEKLVFLSHIFSKKHNLFSQFVRGEKKRFFSDDEIKKIQEIAIPIIFASVKRLEDTSEENLSKENLVCELKKREVVVLQASMEEMQTDQAGRNPNPSLSAIELEQINLYLKTIFDANGEVIVESANTEDYKCLALFLSGKIDNCSVLGIRVFILRFKDEGDIQKKIDFVNQVSSYFQRDPNKTFEDLVCQDGPAFKTYVSILCSFEEDDYLVAFVRQLMNLEPKYQSYLLDLLKFSYEKLENNPSKIEFFVEFVKKLDNIGYFEKPLAKTLLPIKACHDQRFLFFDGHLLLYFKICKKLGIKMNSSHFPFQIFSVKDFNFLEFFLDSFSSEGSFSCFSDSIKKEFRYAGYRHFLRGYSHIEKPFKGDKELKKHNYFQWKALKFLCKLCSTSTRNPQTLKPFLSKLKEVSDDIKHAHRYMIASFWRIAWEFFAKRHNFLSFEQSKTDWVNALKINPKNLRHPQNLLDQLYIKELMKIRNFVIERTRRNTNSQERTKLVHIELALYKGQRRLELNPGLIPKMVERGNDFKEKIKKAPDALDLSEFNSLMFHDADLDLYTKILSEIHDPANRLEHLKQPFMQEIEAYLRKDHRSLGKDLRHASFFLNKLFKIASNEELAGNENGVKKLIFPSIFLVFRKLNEGDQPILHQLLTVLFASFNHIGKDLNADLRNKERGFYVFLVEFFKEHQREAILSLQTPSIEESQPIKQQNLCLLMSPFFEFFYKNEFELSSIKNQEDGFYSGILQYLSLQKQIGALLASLDGRFDEKTIKANEKVFQKVFSYYLVDKKKRSALLNYNFLNETNFFVQLFKLLFHEKISQETFKIIFGQLLIPLEQQVASENFLVHLCSGFLEQVKTPFSDLKSRKVAKFCQILEDSSVKGKEKVLFEEKTSFPPNSGMSVVSQVVPFWFFLRKRAYHQGNKVFQAFSTRQVFLAVQIFYLKLEGNEKNDCSKFFAEEYTNNSLEWNWCNHPQTSNTSSLDSSILPEKEVNDAFLFSLLKTMFPVFVEKEKALLEEPRLKKQLLSILFRPSFLSEINFIDSFQNNRIMIFKVFVYLIASCNQSNDFNYFQEFKGCVKNLKKWSPFSQAAFWKLLSTAFEETMQNSFFSPKDFLSHFNVHKKELYILELKDLKKEIELADPDLETHYRECFDYLKSEIEYQMYYKEEFSQTEYEFEENVYYGLYSIAYSEMSDDAAIRRRQIQALVVRLQEFQNNPKYALARAEKKIHALETQEHKQKAFETFTEKVIEVLTPEQFEKYLSYYLEFVSSRQELDRRSKIQEFIGIVIENRSKFFVHSVRFFLDGLIDPAVTSPKKVLIRENLKYMLINEKQLLEQQYVTIPEATQIRSLGNSQAIFVFCPILLLREEEKDSFWKKIAASETFLAEYLRQAVKADEKAKHRYLRFVVKDGVKDRTIRHKVSSLNTELSLKLVGDDLKGVLNVFYPEFCLDTFNDGIQEKLSEYSLNPFMLKYFSKFYPLSQLYQDELAETFFLVIDLAPIEFGTEEMAVEQKIDRIHRLLVLFINRLNEPFQNKKFSQASIRSLFHFLREQVASFGDFEKRLQAIEAILNAFAALNEKDFKKETEEAAFIEEFRNVLTSSMQKFREDPSKVSILEDAVSHFLFTSRFTLDRFRKDCKESNSTINRQEVDSLLQLVEGEESELIYDECVAVLKDEGFSYIHKNQKLALAAIEKYVVRDGHERNLFLRMGTGQGKSVIIALSAIRLLEKKRVKKVFVFTSYDYLAKRDKENFEFLYESKALKALYIGKSEKLSLSRVNEAQVIYADSEEFQKYVQQYVQERFLSGNCPEEALLELIDPENCAAIFDEGDLITVDQRTNRKIFDMNVLNSYPNNKEQVDTFEQLKGFFEDENFFESFASYENLKLERKRDNWFSHIKSQRKKPDEIDPASGKKISWAKPFLDCLVEDKKLQTSPLIINFVSLARRFQNIIFLSGTITDEYKKCFDGFFTNARQNLFVKVPNFFPERDRSLFLLKKRAVCIQSINDWKEAIRKDISDALDRKQPVLIFIDPNDIAGFSNPGAWEAWLKQNFPNTRYNDIIVEKDVTSNKVVQTTKQNTITIGTSICGRGVDFKISQGIEHGLHVLVTGLPPNRNKRLFEQMIGRTARFGRKGSYSVVVRESLEDFNQSQDLQKLCDTFSNFKPWQEVEVYFIKKLIQRKPDRDTMKKIIQRWQILMEINWDRTTEEQVTSMKRFIDERVFI